MATPIDWIEAVTFEEYVNQLFQDEKTDTEEFKVLVRVYGRSKLTKLWQKFQSRTNLINFPHESECNNCFQKVSVHSDK